MNLDLSGIPAKIISSNSLLKKTFSDPSAISLLYANLFTILLGFFFNWNVLEFMWVYWAQSVIIGIFNFAKMVLSAISPGSNIFGKIAGIFLACFFLFHYGGFHFVYLVFLFFFSVGKNEFVSSISLNLNQFLPFLAFASIIFFLNTLFSFVYYSKKDSSPGTQRVLDVSDLMFRPYVRIIPLHLTIILGGVLLTLGLMNQFVLLFFLLLKTYADLVTYINEHPQK